MLQFGKKLISRFSNINNIGNVDVDVDDDDGLITLKSDLDRPNEPGIERSKISNRRNIFIFVQIEDYLSKVTQSVMLMVKNDVTHILRKVIFSKLD